MFENCTENGYLFLCFENFGLIKNSNQCGSICESKNLNQLGINDFYNFHDRLQQSNFFLKERDDNSYVLYRTFQGCIPGNSERDFSDDQPKTKT